MARKLVFLFFLTFFFNLIWEHLHAVLYVSYQGGDITNFILIQAAVYDAGVTTLFTFPFFRFSYLNERKWLLPSALTVFAIGLELWALETNRWVYAATMPIIPFLDVGLTPILQLGLIGFVSLRVITLFVSKEDIA